jgi:cell volume regulation protein A
VLHRFPIPLAAVLLVAAAAASDLVDSLGGLSPTTNEWIVTVALAVILFDGGMDIGVTRLRPVLGPVLWIGTFGTLVTAGALAAAAHAWFDFGWRQALLVGTALAPTDPAVVFSVLGRREVPGRTRTLLEGESGANDPIGIALLISVLGAHNASGGAVGKAAGQFALQMGVGLAVGVLAGIGLQRVLRSLGTRRSHTLPVLRVAVPVVVTVVAAVVLSAAGTFALAYVAHGSGFLAVFVAGIVVGDAHRAAVAPFTDRLSGLAEVVAFVVLGLSVSLSSVFSHGRVWTGVGLAALLILAVRPLLVGLLLWPVRLRLPERAFVLWAGLKGAVPILLGTLVLAHHGGGASGGGGSGEGGAGGAGVAGAGRIYDVIFVVVVISVVVQGSLVPLFVSRIGPPRET